VDAPETDLRTLFERDAVPLMVPLFGAAMNLTRNARDAEDLIQDTFLRAFEKFGQYEQGTNLKAWLHRIMVNRFINLYRKKKLRNESDFAEAEPFIGGEDAQLAKDYAGAKNARSLLSDAAFLDGLDGRLRKGLDTLPEDYRDVLVMNVVMDLPYKEISTALDIPIGTVMSRLSRAKSILREKVRAMSEASHGR
jgi:RNA polymerase sigma-70 factor, ECF subfamily